MTRRPKEPIMKTSTRSNVVKLVSEKKTAKRPPSKPMDDNAAVIRAAVAYAQNVAAFKAGFDIDPDGDFSTAGGLGLGGLCRGRAAAAMGQLSKVKATTAAAIAAKARIIPLVIEDPQDCDEVEYAFLHSFARDVNEYLTRTAPHEVTHEQELAPMPGSEGWARLRKTCRYERPNRHD